MPRYTSSGKPRGVQITWRLSEEEQTLVTKYLGYALTTAWRVNHFYHHELSDDDARSCAHLALCKVVHNNRTAREAALKGEDGLLKHAISLCVADHVKQCNQIGSDRRKRPELQAVGDEDEQLDDGRKNQTHINFEEMDGRLLWDLALEHLSERHFSILFRRLYLDETYVEIGKVFHITRQEARRLEVEALEHLRYFLSCANTLPIPGLTPALTGLGGAIRPT